MNKIECDHIIGYWDDHCGSSGLVKLSDYKKKDWIYIHTEDKFKHCSNCGVKLE